MSDIPVILSCPLGHVCEEAKDGEIHRCRWYKKMTGKDSLGKDVDRWDCAICWQTELLPFAIMANNGVAAAVESHRNIVDKGFKRIEDNGRCE